MKKSLSVVALTTGLSLAAALPAYATMSGHEVSVTDPYAACVGVGADGSGINYPNTEPEPWVATNPANPANFIGATQQDRWSDGGDKGLTADWSFNDGHTWGNTALPFSKCAAPYYGGAVLPYDRASDPWMSIGPDGRAYTVSISFDANDNNNAVGAATSTDGGVTWQNQQAIQTDVDVDPRQPFNDKESVTADPRSPGVAYAVWDRLSLVPCGPSGRAKNQPRSEDRHWRGADHLAAVGANAGTTPAALDCYVGPTYFSETVNGGVTWSPARQIVENLPNEQTIANQIVVTPTGRLYDFYTYFAATGRVTVEDAFSDNKGLTWSPRQTVNDLDSVGIHDPLTGASARTGDIIPEPVTDPSTGQLYVTWQDGRYNSNGQDDVVIATSPPNDGSTGSWTQPQKVNLPEDRAGFTPGIKVNADGQVGIDYYSLRHPENQPGVWPIDRYIRISRGPAVISPSTTGTPPSADFGFSTPTHDAGPFNMLMAPNAGGYFVGDYEGMAIDRDGRSFHTFFASTNCDTTNCPSVGNPTGAPVPGTSSPPDPFDVYTNQYYRGS